MICHLSTKRNFLKLAASINRFCTIAPENRYTVRSHTCGQLRLEHAGQSVKICGWLRHKRLPKFLVIGDVYGSVQVFNNLQDDVLKSTIKDLTYESVVQVEGRVSVRPPKDRNPNMATGDVELHLSRLTVLNPAKHPLPVDVHDFVTPNHLPRMKYRYLDLRRASMQKTLRFRADVISKMRSFLENHEFVEVETPTLFRRTPGGAQEFVVPSSAEPGKFYSLPQSPQQFKQLLMVAGVDRYFQIARCYRNEGSKSDRQPEFTQLDVELSFTDQQNVMQLIEDVIKASWPTELLSKYSTPKFQQMSYTEAISFYGTDKPDLRFDWRIQRTNLRLSGSPGNPSKCAPGKLEPFSTWTSPPTTVNSPSNAKESTQPQNIRVYPRKAMHFLPIEDTKNIVTTEVLEKWEEKLKADYPKCAKKFFCLKRTFGSSVIDVIGRSTLNLGDLEFHAALAAEKFDTFFAVIANDEAESVYALKTLGLLRIWAADHMEANEVSIRRDEMKFLWVTDFPLFLPQEILTKEQTDESTAVDPTCEVSSAFQEPCSSWESAHHPFTAVRLDGQSIEEFASKPGSTLSDLIGQHYDLVLNGTELGGGSVRIHDSKTQRFVLHEILRENCHEMKHLLEAFDCGAPPHAGFAIGLDRYVALLLKTESIRDVIAFPKTTDGKDLMTQAPSELSEQILRNYHISLSLPNVNVEACDSSSTDHVTSVHKVAVNN